MLRNNNDFTEQTEFEIRNLLGRRRHSFRGFDDGGGSIEIIWYFFLGEKVYKPVTGHQILSTYGIGRCTNDCKATKSRLSTYVYYTYIKCRNRFAFVKNATIRYFFLILEIGRFFFHLLLEGIFQFQSRNNVHGLQFLEQ